MFNLDFIEIFWIHVMGFRDLVPFKQFKKREKHPWTSVTFSSFQAFILQLY